MNGNVKWLFTILGGVLVVLITGWLLSTSAEIKKNSTDVAVLQAQYTEIRGDIQEIKSLLAEIRFDQIRRYNKEKIK